MRQKIVCVDSYKIETILLSRQVYKRYHLNEQSWINLEVKNQIIIGNIRQTDPSIGSIGYLGNGSSIDLKIHECQILRYQIDNHTIKETDNQRAIGYGLSLQFNYETSNVFRVMEQGF